jgi:hypothetical protein
MASNTSPRPTEPTPSTPDTHDDKADTKAETRDDAVSSGDALNALVDEALSRPIHPDTARVLTEYRETTLTDDERDARLTDDERAAKARDDADKKKGS